MKSNWKISMWSLHSSFSELSAEIWFPAARKVNFLLLFPYAYLLSSPLALSTLMAALTKLLRSVATSGSTPRISLSTLSSEPKTVFPAALAARLAPGTAPPPSARNGREERNVQWVFLGCPGVGKGTYASRLSQLLGVPHIATGDLVREELASSGPLSQKVKG